MKEYFIRTPAVLQKLFPDLTWHIPSGNKTLYLTFDDGPVKEATPFVLDTLEKFQAKATFFCVGDNIRKNPDLFRDMVIRGHTVGNHTFHHLKGWNTGSGLYLENIEQCWNTMIQNGAPAESRLFRPPHGRLTPRQAREIKKNCRIIMWTVLTFDYHPGNHPGQLLRKVLAACRDGDIVVFHDSQKGWNGLNLMLIPFLEHFAGLGYRFSAIPGNLDDINFA